MTERWERIVAKYGSEEAARAEMRRRADLSKRNAGGKGGFASMDREKLVKISREAGKKRWNKKDA